MTVRITDYLTMRDANRAVANRTRADIQYIVIHYTGAPGGAEAHCRYFAENDLQASAHLFVGHAGEVFRCVADKDIAWHCGAQTYHNPARNANSIGIELCCRQTATSGRWSFEKATVEAAVALTREYMAKYGIPTSRVVRHFDVTGKICPEPFCGSPANDSAWAAFLARLPQIAPPAFTPYVVRVLASSLNIRTGPGTHHATNGAINDRGSYTIVEEADGPGAKKWGKLKSGLGWISLDHTGR